MHRKSFYIGLILLVLMFVFSLSGCDQFLDLIKDFIKLEFPADLEEGITKEGTIILSKAAIENTVITFVVSSGTGTGLNRLQAPASVIILTGKTEAKIKLKANKTNQNEGDQSLTITAKALGFHDSSVTINIQDPVVAPSATPTTTPTAKPSASPTGSADPSTSPTPTPTVPRVVSTFPDGLTAVDPNIILISATFDRPMCEDYFELLIDSPDRDYFQLFEKVGGRDEYIQIFGIPDGKPETGVVTAIFYPKTKLKPDTTYKAVIKGDVMSVDGIVLGENYTWYFFTKPLPE